jgi:MutL protein
VSGSLATQQQMPGTPGAPSPTTRSVLAVDCGSVYTKVALFGIVDGRYRLLAQSQVPTTSAPPHADVTQAVAAGIADLERISARTLTREGRMLTPEEDDGDGVDAIIASVSAGGPLRLLTAGPARDTLAALVHRATGGLFVALDPLPSDLVPTAADMAGSEWEQQVSHLWAMHPHAVLVVGPSLEGQRGRPDIEETGRAVAALLDGLRVAAEGRGEVLDVPVLYAGLPSDGKVLQAAVEGRASLQYLDPLSPNTLAPLSRAVAGLYESAVLRALPGYYELRGLIKVPPTAVSTSLAGTVRYLSQHYQMNVVGVDVGASATVLVGSTAQGAVMPAAQPTAGTGPGLGAVLRATGAPNIMRWLTEPIEEPELREYVVNHMIRPRLMAMSTRELELEHAFAREAILLALRSPGSTLAGLSPLDVVLGTGGVLAHAPDPAYAALILLDSLQPRGIVSLVLDTAQIAGMLGQLAMLDGAASGELAEGDAVVAQLGSAVCTAGTAAPGQPAVRVSLEYNDGRRHVTDVMQGTIERLPLRPGERAMLSLFPAPTVDVGLGPGQHARASDPVEGGLLGLIVDARGRPLVLPQADEERRALLQQWRQSLGIEE